MDRLKEIYMYALEKRQERDDLIEIFKIPLWHKCTAIFQLKESSAMRAHKMKLKGDRLRSNLCKYLFSERVVAAWNSLPMKVLDTRTVSGFKKAWDKQ